MGSLHLDDLSIRGFRGIRDLHISNLGRVTLITGRNNTGKSSVLEALHLYVNHATIAAVNGILRSREEYINLDFEEVGVSEMEGVLLISPLFHGFPQLPESFEPMAIATTGKSGNKFLSLSVGWASEERDPRGNVRLVPKRSQTDGESEGSVGFLVETEGHRIHKLLLDFLWPPRPTQMVHSQLGSLRQRMPIVYVVPYGNERTSELGAFWDEIVLTDEEKEVLCALQVIAPEISAVSMVGSSTFGSRNRPRKAVVRATNIPHPVPLRTFGEGVNRLFTLALAIVNAGSGILLIDEFENGLHHSVQTDVWRMVFRLARQLDVQVFATTHSRDAVKAFQKAASESPEEGVLLRLARKGDDIVPTVANEEELAIATRHDIEVR